MPEFRVQDLTYPNGKPVEIVDATESGGHQGPPSRKPSGGFRPGAGRPKGRPNTSTLLRRISDDTLYVYEQLGGAEAFAEWAAANPDRFYPMLLATGKAEADDRAKNKGSVDRIPRMIEIVEATPDGSPGRRTALLRDDVVEELGLQVEDQDGREVATWPSPTDDG
jgi:hypothetical protein